MTRARAGSLPGQATSAAPDIDLRVGGRSGSRLRGYEVESSGRTSPSNSSDESQPETVDSRAHRGDSDNLGQVQLSGGGEQVSAEAGTGANQDLPRGAISRGLQHVRPDTMHLRLRLASRHNHDCLSMRAPRAMRDIHLERQFR